MTIPHPVAGGAAGQGEPKLVIIPVDNHRMHWPDEDLVVDNPLPRSRRGHSGGLAG